MDELLINGNADLSIQNKNGKTPLDVCIDEQCSEDIKFLLQNAQGRAIQIYRL